MRIKRESTFCGCTQRSSVIFETHLRRCRRDKGNFTFIHHSKFPEDRINRHLVWLSSIMFIQVKVVQSIFYYGLHLIIQREYHFVGRSKLNSSGTLADRSLPLNFPLSRLTKVLTPTKSSIALWQRPRQSQPPPTFLSLSGACPTATGTRTPACARLFRRQV
jgi:hypothetical protein